MKINNSSKSSCSNSSNYRCNNRDCCNNKMRIKNLQGLLIVLEVIKQTISLKLE